MRYEVHDFICKPYVEMGDSLSERLISELIDGAQEFCEDIGCLPTLIR